MSKLLIHLFHGSTHIIQSVPLKNIELNKSMYEKAITKQFSLEFRYIKPATDSQLRTSPGSLFKSIGEHLLKA